MAGNTIRCDLASVMTSLAIASAAHRKRAVPFRTVVTGFTFDLPMAYVREPVLLLRDYRNRTRFIQDIAVATDAPAGRQREIVRLVTLRAPLQHIGLHSAVHRCKCVRVGVTARRSTRLYCFARRCLFMWIMAKRALRVMWIGARKLIRNQPSHLMTA